MDVAPKTRLSYEEALIQGSQLTGAKPQLTATSSTDRTNIPFDEEDLAKLINRHFGSKLGDWAGDFDRLLAKSRYNKRLP